MKLLDLVTVRPFSPVKLECGLRVEFSRSVETSTGSARGSVRLMMCRSDEANPKSQHAVGNSIAVGLAGSAGLVFTPR